MASYQARKFKSFDFSGQGLRVHCEGEKYPRKGFPDPTIVNALSVIKRFLMLGMRIYANPLGIILFLFQRKMLFYRFVEMSCMLLSKARDELNSLDFVYSVIVVEGKYKVVRFPLDAFDEHEKYFVKSEKFSKSVREIYRIGTLLYGTDYDNFNVKFLKILKNCGRWPSGTMNLANS